MFRDQVLTDKPISLLIVEDDIDFRESSVRWMDRKGHQVSAAASGAEAMSLLDRQQFDVGVFDMNMPGMSGIELLQRIQQENIDIEVIILTGQGTIETAVQAMKLGACDYLTKPCPLGDLEHHCKLARERGLLRKENEQLKAIISRGKTKTKIIGESKGMKQVAKLVSRVAPTDKPVLITGESGTGKEVVARAVQESSHLASKPFVTINCAALPEQLVESELFGHQKGSFTGATSEKPGLFEVADGGTLFIDELGELPLALQPKLLRVLEDGSMRRIGSHKERRVKVRIIAATNRSMAADVAAGRFREDLYYRVNVLPIQLPALREREGDIDLMVDHFLPPKWHVEAEARAAMNVYPWPGNVRELINVIQRATILADSNEITLDDLPREIADVDPEQARLYQPRAVTRQVPENSPVVPRDVNPSFRGNTVPGSTVGTQGSAGPLSGASVSGGRVSPSTQGSFQPPAVGQFSADDSQGSGGHVTSAGISGAVNAPAVGARLDDVAKAHVLEMLERHNGNKAQTARALGIHRRKLYRLLERFQKDSDASNSTPDDSKSVAVEKPLSSGDSDDVSPAPVGDP